MSAERADELLTYYLRTAWEATGLGWTSDNQAEASGIIDALQDMVRDEIRMHRDDAPHVYPDGSTA